MMVVTPDGYVIEAEGLYYSDGKNNDAKILEDMWKKPDSILSILQPRDCLVLDRGFRDVINLIEGSNVDTFMPNCLKKKQKQFTTAEANESRKVTKLRWVVEAANGRLKGVFRFFQDVIAAAYFPKINNFLRIAIALQNAYYPPLFTETEEHENMAEEMREERPLNNPLLTRLERLKLLKKRVVWISADEDDLLEFPDLSMEELRSITLGPYQLDMGRLYNLDHLEGEVGYRFFVHRELAGLIRIKLQSRFSKSQKHFLWIEFKEFRNGKDAVTGWYCQCKSGARTLGCCSHVAAVNLLLILHRIEFYYYYLGITLSWERPLSSSQTTARSYLMVSGCS
jgi:hypothetical protein